VSAPSDSVFRPATGPAHVLRILLMAALVLAVVGVVSGLLELRLISRAVVEGITQTEAEANDARQQLVAGVQLLVWLVTAVAFLVWFYRMHKNLPALGARDLEYGHGWAIGGFFFPILNLVRPMQVMREVWHGSDPEGLARDMNRSGPRFRVGWLTPPMVGWWWFFFLASGVTGGIGGRMALQMEPTIKMMQISGWLTVASDFLEIFGAVVAILLVAQLTRWQHERAERIAESSTERGVAV
jgi:hypothetical protein